MQVWDLKAKGGPAPFDLPPIKAREAVERDPARYSLSAPEQPAPETAPEPKPKPKGKAADPKE